MALSFADRLKHQKTVKTSLTALRGGNLGFKQRLETQAELNKALNALDVKGKKADQPAFDQVVLDLIAGKFINLVPAKFREKLVEVSKLKHDFEAVKKATSDYIENQYKDTIILESAKEATIQ